MRIRDLIARQSPVFSFEFFPPKTPAGRDALARTVQELRPLAPDFVSVTYGAGGSTRDVTLDLVTDIQRDTGIDAMAHLTCVGHTVADLTGILDSLLKHDVLNILALRGDPPAGDAAFRPVEAGFAHANELIAFMCARYDFSVAAAAYPERHVESTDPAQDIRTLWMKERAGAELFITQLFFDPAVYQRFVRNVWAAGVHAPILPGVMPVTNVSQIERFTTMCGASLPEDLLMRLNAVRDNEEAVIEVGVAWAVSQCRALLDAGAPGIHFYTLNKSHATRRVLEQLRREALA